MMALFGGFAQPREQEHYRLPILHTSSAMPLETAWGLTAAICSFAALRISWLAHISTQPHTKRSHHHSRPSQRRHCFTQQQGKQRGTRRNKKEYHRNLCSLVAPYININSAMSQHREHVSIILKSCSGFRIASLIRLVGPDGICVAGGAGEARFLSSARDSSAPTTPELACAPRVRLPPRSALERGATT